MSDRVIVSLAAVPMISGVLLLLLFSRAPAQQPTSLKTRSAAAARLEAARDARQGRWVGVVVAGDTADLAADHDGRVTEVLLEPGARVERDQPILQIDGSDAASAVGIAGAELGQRQSEVARAAARFDEAQKKLERLKSGGNWVAPYEIESAQAAARMAQAELRAARAAAEMGRAKVTQQKRHAERSTLRAPFAGTLVSCDVDPGDSVVTGQVLARIIDDERHVRFAFPPEQAPAEGETALIVREPSSGRLLRSLIKTVKPEVDSSAQLVFATAALGLDEAGRMAWLPGTRVEVSLASHTLLGLEAPTATLTAGGK